MAIIPLYVALTPVVLSSCSSRKLNVYIPNNENIITKYHPVTISAENNKKDLHIIKKNTDFFKYVDVIFFDQKHQIFNTISYVTLRLKKSCFANKVKITENVECFFSDSKEPNSHADIFTIPVTLDNKNDIDDNDIYQFISDRTYSIGFTGSSVGQAGTAWILKDATPENTNDFVYYFATNAHVCEILKTTTNPVSIEVPTNNSIATYNFFTGQEYTQRKDIECEYFLKNKENINTTYKETYTIDNDLKKSIDYRIIKLDLSKSIGLDLHDGLNIENNLLRVNNYCAQHNGYAIDFATSADFYEQPYYIAGYPYNNMSPEWQGFKISNITLSGPAQSREIHLNNNSNTKVYDNSPQIILPKVKGQYFLQPGSSGSMLVNKNKKLLGIYWGGYEQLNQFTPYVSIINSPYYDFSHLV